MFAYKRSYVQEIYLEACVPVALLGAGAVPGAGAGLTMGAAGAGAVLHLAFFLFSSSRSLSRISV